MPSLSCLCCNRSLSVAESIDRGLGPVCAARKAAIAGRDGIDCVDLPFDPETKNIVFRRDDDGTHFNIYQFIFHHSPTGFEWGYGGSGPADFALNILEMFMRERGQIPAMKIQNWPPDRARTEGPQMLKITHAAWALHQDFKWEWVATMPREGGTIPGVSIRNWIDVNFTRFELKAA